MQLNCICQEVFVKNNSLKKPEAIDIVTFYVNKRATAHLRTVTLCYRHSTLIHVIFYSYYPILQLIPSDMPNTLPAPSATEYLLS